MEIVGVVDVVVLPGGAGGGGALDADREGIEGGRVEGNEVGDDGFEGEGDVPGLGRAGSEESVVGAEDVNGRDLVGEGPKGPGDEPAPGEVGGIAESTQYLQKKGRGEVLHGHVRRKACPGWSIPRQTTRSVASAGGTLKAKIRRNYSLHSVHHVTVHAANQGRTFLCGSFVKHCS